jgi:hypothetical protein
MMTTGGAMQDRPRALWVTLLVALADCGNERRVDSGSREWSLRTNQVDFDTDVEWYTTFGATAPEGSTCWDEFSSCLSRIQQPTQAGLDCDAILDEAASSVGPAVPRIGDQLTG